MRYRASTILDDTISLTCQFMHADRSSSPYLILERPCIRALGLQTAPVRILSFAEPIASSSRHAEKHLEQIRRNVTQCRQKERQ